MTDLHKETANRINTESEQLGGTWEDHALRKWSYWETAHRQRCEELEKLQKELEALRKANKEWSISYSAMLKNSNEIGRTQEKEISELKKVE